MKIAIDCRSLRKKPAGVPNFLITVINNLSIQKPTWQLYLLSNEAFHPEVVNRISLRRNVQILVSPILLFKKVAIIWYLFKVPFIIYKLSPKIFYTPIPNLPFWLPHGTKTLITVHDMVYKLFPKTMSWGNLAINRLLHDRSIKTANGIWSVSQYTKSQLELFFPKLNDCPIFVGSAVDKSLFRKLELSDDQKREFCLKYDITQKYILFVGTLEPRKNLSFLLSLMPTLTKQDISLIVVGAAGWGTAVNPQDSEGVKFTGFVDSSELVKMYNLASAYVSTALNEGFGLPQLEAMSCGCPVVSPHNSAMIEVVENAGETIKGWDPKSWVDTIIMVINNRDVYSAKAIMRAQEYDWETVINGLIDYVEARLK